jgi:two-component system, OmpR family, alkaline phosphatase synthesis response regulator PhoP
MPTKVIIVEDEPDISEALGYSLTHEGYRVWSEVDGRRGLDLIRQKTPDLVLLDLMLPGLEGMEVCRQIKSDPVLKGTCIIMVTAKSDESDVLVGLGFGADDYVTKPFKTRELLARVRAVLRRGKLREETSGDVIRCGELVIDALRHEVTLAERHVPLTATEFRLLRFLAANPGRVFSRDQLLNQVIGDNAVVIDRNIDVHVRAIRRKLSRARDVIETIRGVGYRFTMKA